MESESATLKVTETLSIVQSTTARILVIGDLHFSQRSINILDKLKKRVIRQVKKLKPDHVVFLGDTLDRFGTINSERETEAIEFFKEVCILVPTTLLIGNHDIPNKTAFMSTKHGFTGLKYFWNNMTVVDELCVEFSVNGFVFQAVPYCPNGRLQEGLDTLSERSPTPACIFGHQEIIGCDMDGMFSKHGDKWSLTNSLFISGHIHKYQRLQPNVLYVGSPYQDNFGEDVDKSISLITFSKVDDKVEWMEERIRLNLPVKEKIFLSTKEYKRWIPSDNTIYWVTVTGSVNRTAVCRSMDKTATIKADGGRVVFITEAAKQSVREPTRDVLSLRDKVAASIADKPHLQSIFNDVFVTKQ